MPIQAPPRVRFAVAALLAVCAFHTVAHAQPAVPDRVSLSESTITWSTVKYATDAENGFVERVARQEDHRRSHVQDPRAREPLSEGNAAARIRRAHSFHHLQADRPRTALSHRSRRALRDQGRQFLLRLADGVWRHLPHLPGCRARQDVAEAVGFQGGEGECRRSDGVDVAEGQFRVFRGTGEVQEGLDGHRSDLLCHAESRSRRARCARGAEKSARQGDPVRVLDLHDAGAGIGSEQSQDHRRRRNHRADPGLQHARAGRPICPTATRARARARAVSKNCATSRTGRRWASPMRRPICRAGISGA